MRHKIREADIKRKKRTKAISDFLRRGMPDWALPSSPEVSIKQLIGHKIQAKTPKARPPPPTFDRDGDP